MLKQALAEVIIETLRPLQNRYRDLTSDTFSIDSLLAKGADRARSITEETLALVKTRVGLG